MLFAALYVPTETGQDLDVRVLALDGTAENETY